LGGITPSRKAKDNEGFEKLNALKGGDTEFLHDQRAKYLENKFYFKISAQTKSILQRN
jgi:hypothetical protein